MGDPRGPPPRSYRRGHAPPSPGLAAVARCCRRSGKDACGSRLAAAAVCQGRGPIGIRRGRPGRGTGEEGRARLGWTRLCSARLGQARLGSARLGRARLPPTGRGVPTAHRVRPAPRSTPGVPRARLFFPGCLSNARCTLGRLQTALSHIIKKKKCFPRFRPCVSSSGPCRACRTSPPRTAWGELTAPRVDAVLPFPARARTIWIGFY